MEKIIYIEDAPTLKRQDGKLILEGNFQFRMSSQTILGKDSKALRQMQFGWCLECPADMKLEEEGANEMMADKLREDFLKYLNEF